MPELTKPGRSQSLERPRDFPRFAASAATDVGTGRPGAGMARARLAIVDALGASHPVMAPERLAGRRAELGALIDAVELQRAHVVIFGERGIGKTSLVHVFSEVARDAGYLVLYGSCGVEARFDEMFRAFASRIPLLYHRAVSPTEAEADHGRSFGQLLPEPASTPRDYGELFADVIGTRLVLVLDEYDRVRDPGFRRDVAELIKNLSDRAARVQLILTGVAADLDELIGFAPSIRRNVVGLPLRPLADADVADILAGAAESADIHFAGPAADALARIAGGSPYLVRLIAARAANRALDEGRHRVDEADIRASVEAQLRDWNDGLPRHVQALLTRPVTREQWPLLIAAANRTVGAAEGWFTAAEVAGELGQTNIGPVTQSFAAVAGDGDLLEEDNGRYRFRYPALASLLGLSAALARAGESEG